MSSERKPVDLVFEGGGVKGVGLAGAYATLESRGYEPQNVAGASAGAITAALVAAGYSADELRDVVFGLDFRQFQDRGPEDYVPLVRRTTSILLDLGIYEGRRFEAWLEELLAVKGIRTFGDLVYGDEEDPRWRWKLQVVVSDVTTHDLLVLPRDAGKLGIAPDELGVARAVRMSMSIPIYFEPVTWENPQTGRTHVLVDGGMLSNFPVWIFDADGEPEWPTFARCQARTSRRATRRTASGSSTTSARSSTRSWRRTTAATSSRPTMRGRSRSRRSASARPRSA
jgi:NTE family protein